MWSVVLKILSILGIVLLCLLALLLVVFLLALFWPVTYQGGGRAQAGKYRAWFRFRWLFGLVRGGYVYPESDGLQVKVLWLTVYDSGGRQEEEEREDAPVEQLTVEPEHQTQSGQISAEPEEQKRSEQKTAKPEEQTASELEGQTSSGQTVEAGGDREVSPENLSEEQTAADKEQPLFKKMSDLKEKLQYYLELVRDEDNQGLARLCRILKSIRPRCLRAEALVGLGEPDLTGYIYGIYWAIKPFLGKKCHVAVTPDFEERVLEGEIALGGRIMAVVILYHAVRVLLDRRLRQLIRRLKNMRINKGQEDRSDGG